jgi:hypothetical protein
VVFLEKNNDIISASKILKDTDVNNVVNDELKLKALENCSYMVKDCSGNKCFEILSDRIVDGFNGLCITRSNPGELKKNFPLDIPFIWLTNQKNDEYLTTNDIKDLTLKVRQFLKKNKKSVVLLDRIDYLINMFGFNEFLRLVYSLNDEIAGKDILLMINVNPSVLKGTELALLEQELREIPGDKVKLDIELSDDLSEILNYMNYNEKVTYKKISKEFTITKTTTRKRINKLIELGLATVKKNGRNKVVRITDLGRSYL